MNEPTTTTYTFGRRSSWVLHFALIGAVSSVLAPAFTLLIDDLGPGFLPTSYYVLGGLFGTVTGAALGAGLHRLFGAVFGRLLIALMLALMPCVGALWGGTVGLGASFSLPDTPVDLQTLSLFCGALAGAAQLSWFWLPYAVQRGRGHNGRILVALALLAAPFTAWVGINTWRLVLG